MKVGCLIRFADDSYWASSVRGKIGIVTDVRGQFEGLWRPYERWHIDVLVDGSVIESFGFYREDGLIEVLDEAG
jgi:hypothetical protein